MAVVQLLLFADDTALLHRFSCFRNILPRLQKAIDELTQWFRLWRKEVNPDKSAYFDYCIQKSPVPVAVDPPNDFTFEVKKLIEVNDGYRLGIGFPLFITTLVGYLPGALPRLSVSPLKFQSAL
ncbi:hypothetical protein EVAR_96981_1 [Eumeta japonica]|uniref:Reverse transcriptase domain-containing protein n=1 Tax=Eumeta variegata TaxID=151549 RepID=A0A4C1VFD8_EUMVA|nr:hypothetical protein EVAR_96981_1 [Eumeta japonica]